MTPSSRIPMNHNSQHSLYPTSISSTHPRSAKVFDTSLFLLDASGNSPSLSQPYQPELPAVLPTPLRIKRPRSPSQPTLAQGHSPALSPHSSTTTNNYYYPHSQMQNSFSSGESSNLPPNAPSCLSGDSPVVDMQDAYGDGFNEHTTPDFEAVDMPPLADDNIYEDSVDPYTPHPATASSGGYPPSPRATLSPSPKGMASASLNIPGTAFSNRGSPVVKVEQFTPAHSAYSGNGMGANIHPTLLSNSTPASSSPHSGDAGAATRSLTVNRDENGVWTGGLDPIIRSVSGNDGELLFNLKEQSVLAALEVKNAEIQDWLTNASRVNPRARATSAGEKSGELTVKAKRSRAKSFTDSRTKQDPLKVDPAATTSAVMLGESSTRNSAGVSATDAIEIDSSDDSSVASSSNDGSLDDFLGDDESMNTSEAQPTEEDLKKSELEADEEQRRLENDPAFFPKRSQFYSSHPWNDTVGPITRGAGIARQNQPHTANAAIVKYQLYAENIDSASRVATFGSQASRNWLSFSDADKAMVESGMKRLSFGRDKDKDKEKEFGHQRRSSLWGNMVKNSLKRGFSNASENKGKEAEGECDNEKSSLGGVGVPGRKRGDSTASSAASSITSGGHFGPPKQTRSWTKGGPRVDTSSAFAHMAGIGAGIGKSSAHAPTPPERRSVMGVLRRPRSRSELGVNSKLHKPTFGIVGLLGQYGGPPALPIKSPVVSGNSSAGAKLKSSFSFGDESRQRGTADAKQLLIPPDPHRHDGYDDDDDDDNDNDMNENGTAPDAAPSGPAPETRLLKLNITPTMEGFAAHIREKTPKLHPKLMDRIVYEQAKRYKKLVEHRQKHLAAIKNGERCANGTKCGGSVGAIGAGGQEGCEHRRNAFSGGHEGEGEAYSSDDSPTEGKVAAAQFPLGVPQPPVSRLPAEFECPICFKVKKFTKPSDWTKHVHEDVHPFTCTFPECAEPKSFKRKADWVRHENERHRHLEWWSCNLPDCLHTCYRKDNFVQHLVREHKMVEPKPKTQKAAARAAAAGKRGKNKATVGEDDAPTREDLDKVWQIVDKCHKTTNKLPPQEKCRFCGKDYPTWKKLTVHLASHMESISLPVLDLISDDSVVPPTTRSSGNRAPRPGCAPVAPMPRVYPASDMDIDSGNSMPQQRQPADGEYEEDTLPQNTYTNTSYTHHIQQTPPRSSPHMPPGHQFNTHTPPHLPQYPVHVGGANMGYSPEYDMHPGLHSTLNHSFEYSRHELYPSPASTIHPQATSVNNGYSPPPSAYSHQLQPSPSQRLMPGIPGGAHRNAQQQQQQQQQQAYFAYGQVSGQVNRKIGVGVEQVHGQVVAAAHGLAHGLIEDNNGHYPLYAGGTEIPMGMAGMVEMGDPAESQYLGMGYMPR